MKIVADQNIALARELFEQFGDVQLLPGRQIDRDSVRDAQILLVRSVTQVNAALLEGSQIEFVGSATAGTDHINLDYLADNNIHFAYAPGCNAAAVVQYVLSSLCYLCPDWQHQTIGILGCGNVGGRLYQNLKKLGVKTAVCDPFLKQNTVRDLCSFDELLQSDIISLHTPLTTEGPYPTFHLFDKQILERLNPNAVLINAARGGVIDNGALLEHLQTGSDLQVVLDVWEQEPNINTQLLELVELATPHIAGYSEQGKINGSTMLHSSLMDKYPLQVQSNAEEYSDSSGAQLELHSESINEALLASYDIREDDRRLRQAINQSGRSVPEAFDQLRRDYPKRKEFNHFTIPRNHPDAYKLAVLGFVTD